MRRPALPSRGQVRDGHDPVGPGGEIVEPEVAVLVGGDHVVRVRGHALHRHDHSADHQVPVLVAECALDRSSRAQLDGQIHQRHAGRNLDLLFPGREPLVVHADGVSSRSETR